MLKNLIKKLLKLLKSERGNSLAEFAVTTAMMATLATTAAPRFASIGESAKEKKTMANIDRIIAAANNHYMETLEQEGRGRFPGQVKYNVPLGGIAGSINASISCSRILFQPIKKMGTSAHFGSDFAAKGTASNLLTPC